MNIGETIIVYGAVKGSVNPGGFAPSKNVDAPVCVPCPEITALPATTVRLSPGGSDPDTTLQVVLTLPGTEISVWL